jgi:MYXO-CTERM domain-containing protein
VAANLFSADESDVRPGDAQRLVDMGRVSSSGAPDPQPSRAEWWWPLALIALVLLAAEWVLFHRPTRRSIARVLRRTPGGPRAASVLAGRGR